MLQLKQTTRNAQVIMGLLVSVRKHRGFALPTVLIASVILLTILAVSVTATTSSRNSLKTQYYTQLAQIAGEAGVAYAEACLQLNNNVPTWDPAGDGSQPLTPGTDCNGNPRSGLTCPSTDDRCWVAVNGNVRSGFKVPRPTLNTSGKAEAIPLTGYTQLVRSTTNTEWRTYNQQLVQSVAVPALCSGAATSALGWSNASRVTSALSFVSPSGAVPLGVTSSANGMPGPTFFRKDFNLTEAATYTVQAQADDRVMLYIDGRLVIDTTTYGQFDTTGSSALGTANVTLEPGCHTVQAKVVNEGTASNPTALLFSLKKQGTTQEIVVSDISWRVASGNLVGFTSSSYYFSDSAWNADRFRGFQNSSGAPWAPGPINWDTIANDPFAYYGNGEAGWTGTDPYEQDDAQDYTYAPNQYNYHRVRDQPAWNFSSTKSVKISLACDDACKLYVDGVLRLSKASAAGASRNVITTTFNMGAGIHTIGLELYNDGTANNPSMFIYSARNMTDNVVIDNTYSGWYSTKSTYSTVQTLQSYQREYRPSPDTNDCNCSNQGTTNFVPNPSFETAGASYASGLSSATRTSGSAFSGSYFIRATASSTPTDVYISQTVPNVEAGRTYRISGYIRSSVSSTITALFYGRSGYIPVSGQTEFSATNANPGGAWRRFSVLTPPAPPGTDDIILRTGVVDGVPAGTVFDIDAIMVTPGSTLYPYADGSSPGWAWRGTANASISQGPVLAP